MRLVRPHLRVAQQVFQMALPSAGAFFQPRTLPSPGAGQPRAFTCPAPALDAERPSSVARGTAFELLCGEVLSSVFGMELERSGGAGDRGIDLRGWWDLPDQRIRVLGQCKCQDVGGRKMGPVLVREMEGVLHRAQTTGEQRVLGVILSSSGFSKQALIHAKSSQLPMVLAHVEAEQSPRPPPASASASRCLGIVWNDALDSLLHTRFEIRWLRSSANGGRPVLYHEGKKYISKRKEQKL